MTNLKLKEKEISDNRKGSWMIELKLIRAFVNERWGYVCQLESCFRTKYHSIAWREIGNDSNK